ncbi:MAG: hypothetical protein V4751_02995 [Pseudomonadota bacterium]
MTLRVLEFNDVGIRVSDDSGVLFSSPGYALVNGKRIEFGERARQQSRLNPLHCYNQFWHKLNLDAFSRPVAHYRHNADIAFSHLQDLAAATELQGDVLLAVPGSFSRQQLAILLGLIKQCSFRAVGIVDSGLAAAIDQTHSDSVIHADLQLHQVVLSKLTRQGSEMVRESVVQVPGTGWVNLSDSLLQLMNAAFIQQARFNPQHNAESEQMLLDGLPGWLRDDPLAAVNGQGGAAPGADDEEARRNLLISLRHNNSVHQARLPRSSLHTRLQPFYQKIQQQLTLLDPEGRSRLLVSDRLQHLPGFHEEFGRQGGRISTLTEDAIGAACLRYHEVLRSAPEAVHFVTRLRALGAQDAAAPNHVVTQPHPTHALIGHSARPLLDGLLLQRLLPAAAGEVIQGEIVSDGEHHSLRNASANVLINGAAVRPLQRLELGDRVQLVGSDHGFELIRVQHGDE